MKIIITDDKIQYIKNRKKLSEEKVYTEEEFLNNYLGYFSDKALYYLVNKKYTVSLGVKILKFLPFIDKAINDKTKKLLNLKEELIDKGYFIENNLFKEYIKDKEIIITYKVTDDFLKIIHDLNYQLIANENEIIKNDIYEFTDEHNEINYVFSDIIKNIDNTSLNDIGLIYPDEYSELIEKYLSLYNLKMNKIVNISSSNVISTFLERIKISSTEKAFNYVTYKYPDSKYLTKIKTVLNRFVLLEEGHIKNKIISYYLNNLVEAKEYKEALSRVSINSDKEKIYLLGFNSSFPKMYQDEDILLDSEKTHYNIKTAKDENVNLKEKYLDYLSSRKINISYSKEFDHKEKIISSLYNEELFNVVSKEFDKTNLYSFKISLINYTSILDKYHKFKEVDSLLSAYKNTYELDYKTYDNQFKGIVNSENVYLSYTALESYYECAFKYYLIKVLKVEPFEQSISLSIGNFMHAALEEAFTDDFDYEKFKEKFISDNELSKKEIFFLNELDKELSETISFIKKFHEDTHFKEIYHELEMTTSLTDKVNLYGKADKVMVTELNDKKLGIVIDYKTGKANIDLKLVKHGLGMQLFIYYLLFKSNFENAVPAGVYLQKIINQDLRSDGDTKEKSLAFEGYTNSDEDIIKLIDKNYDNSKYIKSMSVNKDGALSKKAKVLSLDEFEYYGNLAKEKVIEAGNNIIAGKYLINPKVDKKGNNLSCQYCPFNDICFKTPENRVLLEEEEDAVE